MIFNTDSTVINWDTVKESQYELGLEGALMHVYENECNYNAIMKAAGISELKYFKETGGDLFVQEAGATNNLIERFKTWIKAAIEKIKQIFKKIMMFISSKVSDDKTFVKKYRAAVLDNFKDFDFKGWEFPMTVPNYEISYIKYENMEADNVANITMGSKQIDDYVETHLKEKRKQLAGGNKNLDHDEMIELIRDNLYGKDKEKTTLKITSSVVQDQFVFIEDTKSNLDTADKAQKKIIDGLTAATKVIESAKGVLRDKYNDKNTNVEMTSNKITNLNNYMNLYRSMVNEITAAYGLHVQAIKDRNRQAKAICVKALNSGSRKSKNESANMFSDIFANVEII